ncbi:MAG: hypothetical protein JWN28_736 [Candidatus Saccharibacteria bacterium]|nr:hypothetical protein [Candidatus Saccharibacteria bacterium]
MEPNSEYSQSNENSNNDTSGSVFMRFFRKHRRSSTEDSYPTTTLQQPEKKELFSLEAKPTWGNPTVLKLMPQQITETLYNAGIEQRPEEAQVVRYVGGIDPDLTIDAQLTFSDYAKKHNLDTSKPLEAVSLYTGSLTLDDYSILRDITGYLPDSDSKPNVKALLSKMTPAGKEFMENVVLPANLKIGAAWEAMLDGNKKPISYFYNLKLSFTPNIETKTAYWVGENYGGEISRTFGPAIENGGSAGPIASGEIIVKLRDNVAGLLYINSLQANTTQWAVDSFIRTHILNENENRIVATRG